MYKCNTERKKRMSGGISERQKRTWGEFILCRGRFTGHVWFLLFFGLNFFSRFGREIYDLSVMYKMYKRLEKHGEHM